MTPQRVKQLREWAKKAACVRWSMDPKDRFDEKWMPEPFSGCWLWVGAYFCQTGYGKIYIGRLILAHRASWELYRGRIPDGMCVCHKCDTPSCVNPAHLFIGTHADNMHDMVRKGLSNRGEKNGASKLTVIQVCEIRAATGRHSDIAKKYDVSELNIDYIKSLKTWKHIL